MTTTNESLLRQVGAVLHAGGTLRAFKGGVIAVDQAALTRKERADEHERETRSPAGSRQGSARRQRAARGPRSSSTPSRIGRGLRSPYEDQLRAVGEAYPKFETFPDKDGLWLLAKSSILPDLAREATFLLALPTRRGLGPRAWGYWTAPSQPPKWIGPRHTNFQDGTICAFSPTDGAWLEGGDLRTLLDLYSVWALRHLHLEAFGLWPGKQYSLLGSYPDLEAHYRLSECEDDELCGCGSETLRYADCCKPRDLRLPRMQLIDLFMRTIPGGFASRRPPAQVAAFIEGRGPLPMIEEVHLVLKEDNAGRH